MSPDIQAALAQALMKAQPQPLPAAPVHQQLPQIQAMMQALARQVANQRQPIGKARVLPGPPIDGGYSGRGIRIGGNLVGRAGFGPHAVAPDVVPDGFLPARSLLGGYYAN